jgi:molybdopterin-guanine dinucleotide biosynthesis protein A
MNHHFKGVKIRQIYISPGHNYFGHHGQAPGQNTSVEVPEAECVAGRGIKGDRFFDFKENYKGQITFFSAEVFNEVCQRTGAFGKSPGVARRNVVTSGMDLNALVGKQFEIQGVIFEGIAECHPCHWMNEAIAPDAEKLLQGRGGLRSRILTDGWLRVDKTGFSAVILAGGKSSRMGSDKAWLEVGGKTLLARQIELAREAGAAEIFISGRADKDYAAFDCRVLQDHFANAGPLAGIERALEAATSPLLLVLAVDMPAMNTGLMNTLLDHCAEHGAIPRVGGRVEPLAAFYPKNSQLVAETLLRAGKNRVTTFAEHCVQSGFARLVDLAANQAELFLNWNTSADLLARALIYSNRIHAGV